MVISDRGLLGEFKTYECLKNIAGYKKFIFNCYLPKDNGDVTEVDLILSHESGIYVFESKNSSGEIYGKETYQYWIQRLTRRNGERLEYEFFNPIIQNKIHLRWLMRYLDEGPDIFYSYVVFGENCTLKDIKLTSIFNIIQ